MEVHLFDDMQREQSEYCVRLVSRMTPSSRNPTIDSSGSGEDSDPGDDDNVNDATLTESLDFASEISPSRSEDS